MSCSICRLSNKELRCSIEDVFMRNGGVLTSKDRSQLVVKFPQEQSVIDSIENSDCEIHYNFHQSASREAVEPDSIAKDSGKDEATILYEMLNSQAATFTLLTNKINGALKGAEEGSLTSMIVHPNLTEFYDTLSKSMRATVHELSELNLALNGKKDGALEGLKALANALTASKEASTEDMTTDRYDD